MPATFMRARRQHFSCFTCFALLRSVTPTLDRIHERGRHADAFAERLAQRSVAIGRGIARTRWRRRVKHLKHETSTKHQCAATIRLEMTGRVARSGAAHTGLVLSMRLTTGLATTLLATRFAMVSGLVRDMIDAQFDHSHRRHSS
jgi:hypothetical protein